MHGIAKVGGRAAVGPSDTMKYDPMRHDVTSLESYHCDSDFICQRVGLQVRSTTTASHVIQSNLPGMCVRSYLIGCLARWHCIALPGGRCNSVVVQFKWMRQLGFFLARLTVHKKVRYSSCRMQHIIKSLVKEEATLSNTRITLSDLLKYPFLTSFCPMFGMAASLSLQTSSHCPVTRPWSLTGFPRRNYMIESSCKRWHHQEMNSLVVGVCFSCTPPVHSHLYHRANYQN